VYRRRKGMEGGRVRKEEGNEKRKGMEEGEVWKEEGR
jgi:hypothetical protein